MTIVTLRFGDHLLDLECSSVEMPDPGSVAVTGERLPEGYVRITPMAGYEPTLSAGRNEVPLVEAGEPALVSDEHVAMIQGEV